MSCQCTTLKGEKCKNPVNPGVNFCYRHLNCANAFGAAKAKAKAKAKVSLAKAKAKPLSSPKFDRFADLPAPVLDQILMDMNRKDLNVLCNTNKRIKRLICDNPGWRNRYNARNPEGVFHENSHFVMSHGHQGKLIFNELRDVRPEEGPLGYREMLNNFVVSVTIDKAAGNIVSKIYYFHDAVRAHPGADVAATQAYIELRDLRFAKTGADIVLRLASPSPNALDDFLTGIGKMHWKPYFKQSPHAIGIPGFQKYYIGKGKAVEEFYDIVKKQISKIEVPAEDVLVFPKIAAAPLVAKKAKAAKRAKAKRRN